jgi:D-alanyl-D-alanine carboxypeptidase
MGEIYRANDPRLHHEVMVLESALGLHAPSAPRRLLVMRKLVTATTCLAALALTVLSACSDSADTSTEPTTSAGGFAGSGGLGGAGGNSGGSGGLDGCQALHAEFQTAIDEAVAEEDSRGGVLAVLTPDCGLWAGASGESAPGEPLSSEHLLRIGSITKTFVATSIVSAATEGLLDLDATVDTWVPTTPSGNVITVRHLLTHTSGLFNYTEDTMFMNAAFDDPSVAHAPEELLAVAFQHPSLFQPGEQWSYSNTNYIMLGVILESVTGSEIATEIRERALTPTSLAHTFFDGEETIVGELAQGYSSLGASVTYAFHPSVPWAAGAMVATAGDLATWADRLYTGAVLGEQATDEMLTGVETGTSGVRYGLGVLLLDASQAGVDLVGHDGSINGYHSMMFYFPTQHCSAVSIVNQDDRDPNTALAKAATILIDRY